LPECLPIVLINPANSQYPSGVMQRFFYAGLTPFRVIAAIASMHVKIRFEQDKYQAER